MRAAAAVFAAAAVPSAALRQQKLAGAAETVATSATASLKPPQTSPKAVAASIKEKKMASAVRGEGHPLAHRSEPVGNSTDGNSTLGSGVGNCGTTGGGKKACINDPWKACVNCGPEPCCDTDGYCWSCAGQSGHCYPYDCGAVCSTAPCSGPNPPPSPGCPHCTGSDGGCYPYDCGTYCSTCPCGEDQCIGGGGGGIGFNPILVVVLGVIGCLAMAVICWCRRRCRTQRQDASYARVPTHGVPHLTPAHASGQFDNNDAQHTTVSMP